MYSPHQYGHHHAGVATASPIYHFHPHQPPPQAAASSYIIHPSTPSSAYYHPPHTHAHAVNVTSSPTSPASPSALIRSPSSRVGTSSTASTNHHQGHQYLPPHVCSTPVFADEHPSHHHQQQLQQ